MAWSAEVATPWSTASFTSRRRRRKAATLKSSPGEASSASVNGEESVSSSQETAERLGRGQVRLAFFCSSLA